MTPKMKKFIKGREKLIYPDIDSKMKLYTRLCDICDFLLKKYNPCKFSCGTCIGLNKTTCCTGCQYLCKTGCTITALQCKLYLCYDVREEGHLYDQLSKLQSIACMNGLVQYRESYEYTKKRLMQGA